MTIEECKEEHRKFWSWIADETIRRKYPVTKIDYFNMLSDDVEKWPKSMCFACEYACQHASSSGSDYCKSCPIDWTQQPVTKYYCEKQKTVYREWKSLRDVFLYTTEARTQDAVARLAGLAREIAELPFKEKENYEQ